MEILCGFLRDLLRGMCTSCISLDRCTWQSASSLLCHLQEEPDILDFGRAHAACFLERLSLSLSASRMLSAAMSSADVFGFVHSGICHLQLRLKPRCVVLIDPEWKRLLTVENCKPSTFPIGKRLQLSYGIRTRTVTKCPFFERTRRGCRAYSEAWTAFLDVFNCWSVMLRGAPISLPTHHYKSEHRMWLSEFTSLKRTVHVTTRLQWWYLPTLPQRG